jgi:FkbM family methyltransferase
LAFKSYNKLAKLTGRRFAATTSFGATLQCDPTDLIQSRVLHFGVWEPEVTEIISRLLSEGDVFVDVGANIGYDSLLGASIVGNAGVVVAIEASPKIFSLLEENISLNAASPIRAVNVAASDAPGVLTLYDGVYGNIGMATTVAARGQGGGVDIAALPLHDILSDDERTRVSLIKIDVEGAELPILSSFLENLHAYSPRAAILVEASFQDDETGWNKMLERFSGAGFKIYAIENRYDPSAYLNWKFAGLTPLSQARSGQTDLLLTRQSPSPELFLPQAAASVQGTDIGAATAG